MNGVISDRNVRTRPLDRVIRRLIHRRVRSRRMNIQIRDRQVLERATGATRSRDPLTRHALIRHTRTISSSLNRSPVITTVQSDVAIAISIDRPTTRPIRRRHRRPRLPKHRDRTRTRPRPLHGQRRTDRATQIDRHSRTDLSRSRTPIRGAIEERHRLGIGTIPTTPTPTPALRQKQLRPTTTAATAAAAGTGHHSGSTRRGGAGTTSVGRSDHSNDRVPDIRGPERIAARRRTADARATTPRTIAILPLIRIRRRAAEPGSIRGSQRLPLLRGATDVRSAQIHRRQSYGGWWWRVRTRGPIRGAGARAGGRED